MNVLHGLDLPASCITSISLPHGGLKDRVHLIAIRFSAAKKDPAAPERLVWADSAALSARLVVAETPRFMSTKRARALVRMAFASRSAPPHGYSPPDTFDYTVLLCLSLQIGSESLSQLLA